MMSLLTLALVVAFVVVVCGTSLDQADRSNLVIRSRQLTIRLVFPLNLTPSAIKGISGTFSIPSIVRQIILAKLRS